MADSATVPAERLRRVLEAGLVWECRTAACRVDLEEARAEATALRGEVESASWWRRWAIPVWVVTGAAALGAGVWVGASVSK